METTEINDLRKKWEAEIEALLRHRAEIDNKIMGFQTMIKGLQFVETKTTPNWTIPPIPLPPGMENLHSLGLTDAIRLVLTNSGFPLMPVQIRDRLAAHDYKQLPESNPMAAVHGVLRRLEEANEIEPVKIDSSKTGYRILSPVEQALLRGPLSDPDHPLRKLSQRPTRRSAVESLRKRSEGK